MKTLISFVLLSAAIHGTYPDPRVEWVTMPADGMILSAPHTALKPQPLPAGSFVIFPRWVTGPVPHTHKEA